MGSPWTDLDRPPLSQRRLQRDLTGTLWSPIRVVEETDSTNADVAAAARENAGEGLVVVAERQRAGRGRLDRGWESPARAGLTVSVLLRPTSYGDYLPLLPLLTGVAVADAVEQRTEVRAGLKWPNDLLAPDERKLGGILIEVVGDGIVVGIGLNVTTTEAELPVETATSLALAGASNTDREPLLKEILRALAARYDAWPRTPQRFLPDYRRRCDTIGRRVRVELPGGRAITGRAVDVDEHGRLLVDTDEGTREPLSVGDVVHVRSGDA